MILVEGVFDWVVVDCFGFFFVSDFGNCYIVVFFDYLICYLEVFVVFMIDVLIIVDLLVNEILFCYGVFCILFLDRGFNFFFCLVKEVCFFMDMKKMFIISYYF